MLHMNYANVHYKIMSAFLLNSKKAYGFALGYSFLKGKISIIPNKVNFWSKGCFFKINDNWQFWYICMSTPALLYILTELVPS